MPAGLVYLLTVNPMMVAPVTVVPVTVAGANTGTYYNLRKSAPKGKYHHDGNNPDF